MAPGVDLAVRIVGASLAAEAGEKLDWPDVPKGEQIAAVQCIIEQRVTWLVARHASDEVLAGQAGDLLRLASEEDVLASMRVQSAAATLVTGLLNAGIPCLTYKGTALAVATTGDPSARGSGDVDLLVDQENVRATHEFLLEAGAEFVAGYSPSPDSDLWQMARRFGCELPYRWRGVDIDLHWRFDRLPQIAKMPFGDLWPLREVVELGSRSIPTLGAVDALLVTVAHGTKEHWRHWRWIVDLVRQARAITDWETVRQRARTSGCEKALAIGLAIHEYLAPQPAPFSPTGNPRILAAWAWSNSCAGTAPFDGVSLDRQVARLRWTRQTLPSIRAAGSFVARQAYTPLDMAELPLPRELAWCYPSVRPALWARRLLTGRYGPRT